MCACGGVLSPVLFYLVTINLLLLAGMYLQKEIHCLPHPIELVKPSTLLRLITTEHAQVFQWLIAATLLVSIAEAVAMAVAVRPFNLR